MNKRKFCFFIVVAVNFLMSCNSRAPEVVSSDHNFSEHVFGNENVNLIRQEEIRLPDYSLIDFFRDTFLLSEVIPRKSIFCMFFTSSVCASCLSNVFRLISLDYSAPFSQLIILTHRFEFRSAYALTRLYNIDCNVYCVDFQLNQQVFPSPGPFLFLLSSELLVHKLMEPSITHDSIIIGYIRNVSKLYNNLNAK